MMEKRITETTPKSSYVVMKETQSLYLNPWDIHCVCADRKTAKAECAFRNARSRANTYFVKRVPFVSTTTQP
jgi:hypothetical protein